MYENVCYVLGSNPLFWLWPKRKQGDGLTFPVIQGTDPRLPFYWPPRDPDDLRPSIFSSKYKRQQEIQQILRQDPNAIIEDSEGYYDSGSFVTDSENEYTLNEEEQSMNHNIYNLSGTYYREYPSEEEYDEDEDEDTIPLASFTTPRKKIPSSKED